MSDFYSIPTSEVLFSYTEKRLPFGLVLRRVTYEWQDWARTKFLVSEDMIEHVTKLPFECIHLGFDPMTQVHLFERGKLKRFRKEGVVGWSLLKPPYKDYAKW